MTIVNKGSALAILALVGALAVHAASAAPVVRQSLDDAWWTGSAWRFGLAPVVAINMVY